MEVENSAVKAYGSIVNIKFNTKYITLHVIKSTNENTVTHRSYLKSQSLHSNMNSLSWNKSQSQML